MDDERAGEQRPAALPDPHGWMRASNEQRQGHTRARPGPHASSQPAGLWCWRGCVVAKKSGASARVWVCFSVYGSECVCTSERRWQSQAAACIAVLPTILGSSTIPPGPSPFCERGALASAPRSSSMYFVRTGSGRHGWPECLNPTVFSLPRGCFLFPFQYSLLRPSLHHCICTRVSTATVCVHSESCSSEGAGSTRVLMRA